MSECLNVECCGVINSCRLHLSNRGNEALIYLHTLHKNKSKRQTWGAEEKGRRLDDGNCCRRMAHRCGVCVRYDDELGRIDNQALKVENSYWRLCEERTKKDSRHCLTLVISPRRVSTVIIAMSNRVSHYSFWVDYLSKSHSRSKHDDKRWQKQIVTQWSHTVEQAKL